MKKYFKSAGINQSNTQSNNETIEKASKQIIMGQEDNVQQSSKKRLNFQMEDEMNNEMNTPVISDREDEETIKKSPCQLLYLTPNHVKEMWKKVQEILQGIMSANKLTSFGVQGAIEEIYKTHFNMGTQMAKRVNFGSLKIAIDSHSQKENILKAIQMAAKLSIQVKNLFSDFIPLLESQQNQTVQFSQEQCACLVANMFFCTLHLQPDHKKYPQNFMMAKLFQNDANNDKNQLKIEKIKCYLNYFLCIDKNGYGDNKVTFERRVLQPQDILQRYYNNDLSNRDCKINFNIQDISKEFWNNNKQQLCEVKIKSNGKIEDENGAILVDFANMYIGGGVLGEGCVQEEILFLIYPQLLVSVLITQKLEINESLFVKGVRRYNNYSGYSNSFKFTGSSQDISVKDITCIDAKCYSGADGWIQYSEKEISQELTKAFVGFKNGTNKVLSTGRWGCGAFKGDWQLKFFIQWLAASFHQYQLMIFYNIITEQPEQQKELLKSVLTLCQYLTVGQLHKKVQLWATSKINKSIPESLDLITFLTIL